jgi:hypothetical protein
VRRGVWLLGFLAVLAVGCGGTEQTPHFQVADGWHVIVEPGQIVSAANIPFAAADRSESAPTRTVASLPPRGIVISVQWLRRRRLRAEDRQYPRSSLPLRVQSMARTQPEGFTCPPSSGNGCATRALQAASKRWDVAVWVFFGTAHPSMATVAAAGHELAHLRFA